MSERKRPLIERVSTRLEQWAKDLEKLNEHLESDGFRNRMLFEQLEPHPNRWDPTSFEEYIIQVSRDRQLTLRRADFPKQIELGEEDHNVFNQMRRASQDGHERVFIAGVSLQTRQVVRGDVATGNKTHISGTLIGRLKKEKLASGEIDNSRFVAHSHPRRLWKSEYWLTRHDKKGMFSNADLYNVANPNDDSSVSGLVDGHWNLLAFETKESRMVEFDYLNISTQEGFSRHWYASCGIGYEPHDYRNDTLGKVWRLDNSADYSMVVPEIAYHHLLVLYRGRPDQALERVNLNDLLKK